MKYWNALLHGGDKRRAEAQVGHEMAVHDVDMNHLGVRDAIEVLTQIEEICGKYGGRNLDEAGHRVI